MSRNIAHVESVSPSFFATVVLLLIAMMVGGGVGVSGAAILTFSIWLSILGLVAVGALLTARGHRPIAGAAHAHGRPVRRVP